MKHLKVSSSLANSFLGAFFISKRKHNDITIMLFSQILKISRVFVWFFNVRIATVFAYVSLLMISKMLQFSLCFSLNWRLKNGLRCWNEKIFSFYSRFLQDLILTAEKHSKETVELCLSWQCSWSSQNVLSHILINDSKVEISLRASMVYLHFQFNQTKYQSHNNINYSFYFNCKTIWTICVNT